MLALLLAACAPAVAQQIPANITKEDLAKNNKLFVELASKALKWDVPTDPIKIVGPLYFVGTAGLSSWLFATSQGHILLNTGTPNSGPMIVESIRKLGLKPEDIKIIINGHGHSDHAGAFAYIKRLSARKSPSCNPTWRWSKTAARAIFTTATIGRSWASRRSRLTGCFATATQ